ncbi:MAG: ferredoxin [Fretibacterium sp.]|nr:ferredoxin [Fretibacterium sp.]
MKILLDQTACIGCGVCTQVSPEIFVLDAEAGVARLLQEETDDPTAKEAENSCPVGCIRVE